MKTLTSGMAVLCSLLFFGFTAFSQPYTQDFDDLTSFPVLGWSQQNNSAPVGTSPFWFQGDNLVFDAYNGVPNAYIACSRNNTSAGGTISNWLITPNRTLRNGDVFTFYTRTNGAGPVLPDRLEVRMSTNGGSTNVGTSETDLGDFTTLLHTVNPSLTTSDYPTIWTLVSLTISGLPAPTSGRLAFRYYVTSAGPTGPNSDYIGIDNVVYTPYTCPAFTMTPGGALTGGSTGSAYSKTLTQTGALGTPNYAITAGALPPGMTLSASGTISGTPTATGTFNFGVTVADASGCSDSQSYSITIVCSANPISIIGVPTLCDNDSPYTLVQGSPAGGTYSGTGVSGGEFDPAAGTQTITYDLTDPYGCPHASNYTITVNTAPTVTQSTISAICDNSGTLALTGGSPAGGTYSGTGVTGSDFDPMAGTQTVTYTYTDANGCVNDASTSITVNTAPTVTQSAISAVCDNSGTLALTGGSPTGGTYSGTGVSGSDFDPASGTQTVTYTYTDANGCVNDASTSITVNTVPTVTQSTIPAICDNSGTLALTGGSPAGGTYSGTGVTGSDFDPMAGTQTIMYTYTDANGCVNDASTSITVNTAPVVAQSTISVVCSNSGALVLTGGSPAGGTYSGTGVSGGEFDPMSGTQTVTYTYTDANGCVNDASTSIIVNTAPTVAFTSPVTAMCLNNAPLTLSGGSPAGGTYSGTGVSGGIFDPATAGAGNHVITYSFTAANGCDDEKTITMNVSACLGLTENGKEFGLEVYPNPATDKFTACVSSGSDFSIVSINDIQGKEVSFGSFNTSSTSIEVDFSNQVPGIYLINGLVNGQRFVFRVQKQ